MTKPRLIMIFVLGIVLATPLFAFSQPIVISAFEGDEPLTGTAAKVMTEAYRRMGWVMELKQFPGERALQVANDGVVDGDLYRMKGIDQAYPHLVVVPVSIVTADVMVFAKDKIFPVRGWKSLLPYRVGYRIGVKSIEANLIPGTQSEAVSSLTQLYKKLQAGRNDVVVDTRLSGLATIHQMGMKDIVMLEPPIMTIQLFHVLHEKNKHLVGPLTKVLKQMEKEGAIRDMQKRAEQTVRAP